ncbi:MAG: MATE family efflux transporter [Spirochaetota bacterium]
MKRDYSRSQVYRGIFALAWPSILEQILAMTVGIVSTAFVGRIGTRELAAVGLVGMIVIFIQTIFVGLATGSTVLIARMTGEGDHRGAKQALIQSLFVGAASGILITVIALAAARPLLGLFLAGTDPEVLRIGLSYYLIVMIGTPFMVFDLVVAGAVRGSGDTRTPMLVSLGVNALNILLNAILVPRLGVAGSAIAVMTSRIVGGIARVVVVFLKPGPVRLGRGDTFVIDMSLVVRILRIGFPAFIEQMVMQGGFLMMQVIIIDIGVVSSAAFQVGINVNSFAFMPVFGLSIAVTMMVGQSLGRGDLRGAGILAFESNVLGVLLISAIGVANLILSRWLSSLFTIDPAVITLGASMIALFAIVDPFLGVMNMSAGVLRAAGDIVYVTVTALVGLWVFRIGVALLLARFFNLGILGVMIGIALDFIVRAGMYGFRVRAGRWKHLKV